MLRDKIEELSLHRSENRACRNVSSLSEKSGLLEKRRARVFFYRRCIIYHFTSVFTNVVDLHSWKRGKRKEKKKMSAIGGKSIRRVNDNLHLRHGLCIMVVKWSFPFEILYLHVQVRLFLNNEKTWMIIRTLITCCMGTVTYWFLQTSLMYFHYLETRVKSFNL